MYAWRSNAVRSRHGSRAGARKDSAFTIFRGLQFARFGARARTHPSRRVTVSRLRFGTDLIAMFHRSKDPQAPSADRTMRSVVYQRQRHTLTHVVTSRRLIDRSNSPPGATRDRHAPTPVQRTTEEDAHAAPRCWFLLPECAPNAVMQSALLRDLSMFRSVQRALTASTHATCGSTTGSLPPTYRAEGVLIASPPPRPSPPSRLSPLGCWSSLRLARPRRCCGADCQP